MATGAVGRSIARILCLGRAHLLPRGLLFPEELSASFQAILGIGDDGISDSFAKGRITLNF